MKTVFQNRLNRHFGAASALVAAAAITGAAGSARATIVYSGVVNINIPTTTAGVYLNVVTGVNAITPAGSPGWDINLYSTLSLYGWQSTPTTPSTVWISAGTNLSNLPVGTIIDGTGAFTATSPSASTTAPAGYVSVLNGNNIYGFRFINENNANQIHYGWVRVSVSASFTSQPRTLIDYAYENQAGVGIAAGATSSTPACYANCDNSTTAPVLNVADFTCFLQTFAAGNPSNPADPANCDGSTQVPVLNVADFTCFLQKFAAGCS